MKRLLALIFATMSLTPVYATQYFGFDLGINNCYLTSESNKGMKNGIKSGIKYGYLFNTGIRTEAEVAYRVNHFKTIYNEASTDVISSKEYRSKHSWAYMLNIMYDIAQISTYDIVPYIGAGMGYCANTEKKKIKYENSQNETHEEKLKENRFSYQGIVGVKYALNQSVSTSLEYSYFTGKSHQKDHSISVFIYRGF